MKVIDARYLKSAMSPDAYPKDGRPEIAFVGRSNVGKSTLLNALLKKKSLAKTSGTPGKTQTVNFFEINATFYFVDLPGYGYAKVPLKIKRQWGRVMTSYLKEREPLKMAVQLLDSRREPSDQDYEMLALLEDAQVPTLVVATKIDKLKRSERARNLRQLRASLDLDEGAEIIPFSSHSGEGLPNLWAYIEQMLDID